ncbi:MAG: hypothetical protein MZV63_46655 [Marinilabiliales bacterium]|nr:hypothetical protein [Marinilabiliales bacterium]
MVKQDSITVTGQKLSGHTVSLEDVMNQVVHEIRLPQEVREVLLREVGDRRALRHRTRGELPRLKPRRRGHGLLLVHHQRPVRRLPA